MDARQLILLPLVIGVVCLSYHHGLSPSPVQWTQLWPSWPDTQGFLREMIHATPFQRAARPPRFHIRVDASGVY